MDMGGTMIIKWIWKNRLGGHGLDSSCGG